MGGAWLPGEAARGGPHVKPGGPVPSRNGDPSRGRPGLQSSTVVSASVLPVVSLAVPAGPGSPASVRVPSCGRWLMSYRRWAGVVAGPAREALGRSH